MTDFSCLPTDLVLRSRADTDEVLEEAWEGGGSEGVGGLARDERRGGEGALGMVGT